MEKPFVGNYRKESGPSKIEKEEALKRELQDKVKDVELGEMEMLIISSKQRKMKEDTELFLKEHFETWGWKEDMPKEKIQAVWKVRNMEFKDMMEQEAKPEDFGKYILRYENALLDYESFDKPEIFNPNTDQDFKEWLQKEEKEMNIGSLMDYIQKAYSGTHYLPGFEYSKYLTENPKKVPKSLKDDYYHLFPSSVSCGVEGVWQGSYGAWRGDEWQDCGDADLTSEWGDNVRVILFKK